MNRPFRNNSSSVYSIAASGLLFGVASAQDAFETPKKVSSIEGITESGSPMVFACSCFRSDAAQADRQPDGPVRLRHQGYGETGMAHLLEHGPQGHADPSRYPGCDEGSRSPVRWLNGSIGQTIRDPVRV